jgi:hypothetical protein
MVGNRYRLLKPASAVYPGEKPSCVHLPKGSIIRVIEGYLDGARLVGVVPIAGSFRSRPGFVPRINAPKRTYTYFSIR